MNIFNEDGLIDPDIQDILYELGNVGIGSASMMLGDLMGVRLNIGVPDIIPVAGTFLPENMDSGRKMGILIDFYKTLSGSMLFIIDEEFMNQILMKLCSQGKMETEPLPGNERTAAAGEFGELISGAYLNAVAKYSGIRIFVQPIWIKEDMEEALFQETMKRLDGSGRRICVDTRFSVVCGDGSIRNNAGRVVILPDEESVEKMSEILY